MVSSYKAKISIVINALVTMVTASLSLILLLIAPLGLASVITLTLLIAGCTFIGGLLGDAALLWLLRAGPKRSDRDSLESGRRLPPQR